MTSHLQRSLLRRTAVAIAAVAASLVTLPAAALTMSLPGGGSCTTPVIATQPDGSLSLTCGSTQQQPPPVTSGPDTFTLSASVSAAAVNTPFTATITRTGTPSTSNVGLNLAVYGACSSPQAPAPAGGTATFTPTTTTAFTLTINPTATGGCNIMFNVGYGGGTAANASMTVPVGNTVVASGGGGGSTGGGSTGGTTGTGANGVPIVAGCPTPTNATMFTMPATNGAHPGNQPNFPNGSLVFPSGVVGAAPLPATLMVSGVQHAQAQLQLTYSAFSPQFVTDIEIAISHCPGVIDKTGVTTMNSSPYCYFDSTNTADLTLTWVGKLVDGFTPAMQAANQSRCYAIEGDQNLPWYANIRYIYTGNCFNGDCGEQFQWNDSTP